MTMEHVRYLDPFHPAHIAALELVAEEVSVTNVRVFATLSMEQISVYEAWCWTAFDILNKAPADLGGEG